MTVKRIVVDIATGDVPGVRKFYDDLFNMAPVMDQGWIVTLASGETANVQLSIASEGGSGTQVPDMSIEVHDVDAVYALAKTLNVPIVYDLTDEPWGVRRFYARDPAGKVLNILAHAT